jgi:hypothetical protein
MIAQAKIAKTLTAVVMITALVVSFAHIVMTFTALGAGWDRWVAPVMIDTVAIIGKIYTGKIYTAATRRAGRLAFYAAGAVSLAANVGAGFLTDHYGSMIVGVFTVSAALWGEGMISKGQVKASAIKIEVATCKTNKAPKVIDQAKRDAINARRREQRAAKKIASQVS